MVCVISITNGNFQRRKNKRKIKIAALHQEMIDFGLEESGKATGENVEQFY